MNAHQDHKNYREWSLESTMRKLAVRFPASMIWIILPSYMHLNTFSCYRNFVASTDMGIPTFSEAGKAWEHLSLLLSNVVESTKDLSRNDMNIRIVGFSKGCVVLNQLLYEIPIILQSEEQVNCYCIIVIWVMDIYKEESGHHFFITIKKS